MFSKLPGIFGDPMPRFSGRMNWKFGAVYSPALRPLVVGTVPVIEMACTSRVGGRNGKPLRSNSGAPGRKRHRPATAPFGGPGSTAWYDHSGYRSSASPVQAFTSTADTFTTVEMSVVKP